MSGSKSIPIKGYRNLPVANTFIPAENSNSQLAVFFPGRGYNNLMPLLYYTSKLIQEKGFDVLLVNYDYSNNEAFNAVSQQEQGQWIAEDGIAVMKAILAQNNYDNLVVVGKSLGTYAMCKSVAQLEGKNLKLVWLTPLIRNNEVFEMLQTTTHSSLLIIGTNDPHNNAEKLEAISANSTIQLELYENADHSMEIENNIIGSVAIMQDILQKTNEFI